MSAPPPPPRSDPPPSGYPPHPGPLGYRGAASPWPQPAQIPKRRGNSWKWALGAVALIAVVATTAAVTLAVADRENGGQSSPTGAPPLSRDAVGSGIASATDTGPATVITEDRSCAMQRPILDLFSTQTANGWEKRDPAVPATAWTPQMRTQYEQAAAAMRSAAEQLMPAAKLTPHRVMRELYEQFIAYARSYADSVPTYTATADNFALVANSAADAIGYICASISTGSADARGPLIAPRDAPSPLPSVAALNDPRRFLVEPNPICAEWDTLVTDYSSASAAWRATDSRIPASRWTPEQRAVNHAVVPVMERFADQAHELGQRSNNPTFQDFADLGAQYRAAVALALPTYTQADDYLASVAARLSGLISAACWALA